MDKDVERLLQRAEKPSADAVRLHPLYGGKVQVVPKVPIRSLDDFAVWYTPGVAAVCRLIANNKKKSFEYTNRMNTIAIVSDGTRVLGLGDIGPEAGLPVMEGKALIFKYLGGVDAVPLCVSATEIDELVSLCKWISPSFGGINIEDIESPKCFFLLDKLQSELQIPVFHDDQQGTAVVVLAALKSAMRVVNKSLEDIKVAMVGMGAANVANLRLLLKAGVRIENVVACDKDGIVADSEVSGPLGELLMGSNPEGKTGGIPEALEGTDVCIAFSKPGPDTIRPEWLSRMNEDAVVFACANPIPEIWPWDAKASGAKVVATGRSDFPNQVNNSLGFPAIFRGVLDVRAKKITDEMCIAAADAISDFAYRKGIDEEHIVPSMDDEKMYVEEAIAVAKMAMKQKVAQIYLDDDELEEKVRRNIKSGKEIMSKMFGI
ncbi:MAG: NADP-dependent malic enzyme [Synergistetes bacterium]|nr:NADP-dependent malic enzyme [Synergistota bacterium]